VLVKFSIQQVFDGHAMDLCNALTSEKYLASMGKLADLGAPELISQKRVKGTVTQQLRTTFQGKLPSVALKVIDPAKLSWDEFAEIDTKRFTATFSMVPTHYQSYFRCGGGWDLIEAADGNTTTRRINGELKVSSPIPFVNGQVERAIINGLRDRLGQEPAIYRAYMAG
jgi:Protein of unknown function (DUF2505)